MGPARRCERAAAPHGACGIAPRTSLRALPSHCPSEAVAAMTVMMSSAELLTACHARRRCRCTDNGDDAAVADDDVVEDDVDAAGVDDAARSLLYMRGAAAAVVRRRKTRGALSAASRTSTRCYCLGASITRRHPIRQAVLPNPSIRLIPRSTSTHHYSPLSPPLSTHTS